MFRMHSGIPNATIDSIIIARVHISVTLALYFRGHEDDSERVETCRPKIAFYVIKLVCVFY